MDKTTEELILENRVFIKEAFEKMGFGDAFNKAFDKGAADDQEKIDFPRPGILHFDSKKNERVEYMPNVILNPNPEKEGQYLFKGYQATRYADAEKPRTHYFHVFKKTGLHAEKAHAKLIGKTVRETVVDDNGNLRSRYSKLLLDQEKTPAGNYKSANTTEKTQFEIVKILGTAPLQANPGDDKDIANKLQFGETVSATFRGQVPMRVDLELDVKKGGVVVKATNDAGQVREFAFKNERTMTLATGVEKSQGQEGRKSTSKMTTKENTRPVKKAAKAKIGGIKENIKKLVKGSDKKNAKPARAKAKRA
jgi:hypothetical protein